MSNAYGIGAFAEGLGKGFLAGQGAADKALDIRKKREDEVQRKQALDLGDKIGALDPQKLTAPQQELQGPTQDGQPLMSVGGADQIQALRNEAMKLTGEALREGPSGTRGAE
jgi:hypothetical protein